jgi:probable addiction module antidote protein
LVIKETLSFKETFRKNLCGRSSMTRFTTRIEYMKANKTSRPHDEAVIDMLKNDPDFANEYLAVALEEADQPGGQQALLTALRHIAEAQGMSAVAERAGIPRESLYRALGPRGNPTIKTLLAVLGASGLHLSVTRETA